MRTFLGVLMVLIVSGDEKTQTISGILEDSVLLPCICSGINVTNMFRWQMEEPQKKLMFSGTHKGRVKTFLNETNNNCSVLLTNITAGDNGKYRCRFFNSQNQYKAIYVNLSVSAPYTVCQDPNANKLNANSSVKVFQCAVSGRYRDAEIQWKLDGQLLKNVATTIITTTHTWDALTGLYHFHSNLSHKLNTTLAPACDVKAKGISSILSYDCKAVNESMGTQVYIRSCLTIIPIVLVLVSLVLWHCWKFPRNLRRKREMEANNSY